MADACQWSEGDACRGFRCAWMEGEWRKWSGRDAPDVYLWNERNRNQEGEMRRHAHNIERVYGPEAAEESLCPGARSAAGKRSRARRARTAASWSGGVTRARRCKATKEGLPCGGGDGERSCDADPRDGLHHADKCEHRVPHWHVFILIRVIQPGSQKRLGLTQGEKQGEELFERRLHGGYEPSYRGGERGMELYHAEGEDERTAANVDRTQAEQVQQSGVEAERHAGGRVQSRKRGSPE
ncbi:hypothetical protein C8R44DRAFT_750808 [Mycena epipterygia]|nr:hypothetical protein C8R44DRAFT_750808 [Mycena epipterygia]